MTGILVVCFAIASLAIGVGVLVEWLEERARAKRRQGYVNLRPPR